MGSFPQDRQASESHNHTAPRPEACKLIALRSLISAWNNCGGDVRPLAFDHPTAGENLKADGSIRAHSRSVTSLACVAQSRALIVRANDFGPNVVPLCLLEQTIVPQRTETAKFIFGKPLSAALANSSAGTIGVRTSFTLFSPEAVQTTGTRLIP